MDNASKAVLMVGAILIAVLLISLGVYVFNFAANKTKQYGDKINESEIVSFNGQFIGYIGSNQSPSMANTLVSKVRSSNANYDHQVTINGSLSLSIPSRNSYNISISSSDYDTIGYISNINVN